MNVFNQAFSSVKFWLSYCLGAPAIEPIDHHSDPGAVSFNNQLGDLNADISCLNEYRKIGGLTGTHDYKDLVADVRRRASGLWRERAVVLSTLTENDPATISSILPQTSIILEPQSLLEQRTVIPDRDVPYSPSTTATVLKVGPGFGTVYLAVTPGLGYYDRDDKPKLCEDQGAYIVHQNGEGITLIAVDGMGGHEGGREVSKTIVTQIVKEITLGQDARTAIVNTSHTITPEAVDASSPGAVAVLLYSSRSQIELLKTKTFLMV